MLPCDDTGMNVVWVAQRIKDGHFVPIHNIFVIREIDFNDTENFKWSSNIKDIAWSWGQWKEGEVFDFSLI